MERIKAIWIRIDFILSLEKFWRRPLSIQGLQNNWDGWNQPPLTSGLSNIFYKQFIILFNNYFFALSIFRVGGCSSLINVFKSDFLGLFGGGILNTCIGQIWRDQSRWVMKMIRDATRRLVRNPIFGERPYFWDLALQMWKINFKAGCPQPLCCASVVHCNDCTLLIWRSEYRYRLLYIELHISTYM